MSILYILDTAPRRKVVIMPSAIDTLDADIVSLFSAEPRIGILEASRRLGVARGTVQARLDKLTANGVITSFAPSVDPAALGYRVTAFANVEIRQGARDRVAAHLSDIPEVLEVHTITGEGDLLCRIVGRDNDDLQRVIDDVVGDTNVVRMSTLIALSVVVAPRILPLVHAAAKP